MVKRVNERTLRRIRLHAARHAASRQKQTRDVTRKASDALSAWQFSNADRASKAPRGLQRLVQELHTKGRRRYMEFLQRGIRDRSENDVVRVAFLEHIKYTHARVHKYKRLLRRVRRYQKMLWAVAHVATFQRVVLRWLWRPDGPMARRTQRHFTSLATTRNEL